MKKFLERMWVAIQEHQQRRVAYWQLQTFSDKQLKDIGLTRAEIHRAVYGNAL